MEEKPIVLHSEIKHNGWLKLRVDKIKIQDMEEPYNYDVVKIGDGVAILPFLDKETLLLETQYRHPVEDTLLELVQGGIKKGETPEQAAQRELLEETGYEGLIEKMFIIYPLPGSLEMKLHIMKATNLEKKQEPKPDPGERFKITIKPYSEVVNEILAGNHMDSALVMALMYFEKKYSKV